MCKYTRTNLILIIEEQGQPEGQEVNMEDAAK